MDEKKTVCKRLCIDPYLVPADELDHIVEDGKGSLFKEAAKQISEGVFYKIIYKTMTEADPVESMAQITFSLAIEPLRMKHMEAVYKAPEDIYFRPEKSLKDKLRNCIRYLKDRSGGNIEWRETDEGI